MRVALHALRRVGYEEYLTGEADGRPVLVVAANEEIAEELAEAYPLEALPATIADLGRICAEQELALVGIYGLEGPEELSVFREETLPLFLEER